MYGSRENERICNLPPIPVKTVNGENVSFVLIDRLFSADLYKKLDSWLSHHPPRMPYPIKSSEPSIISICIYIVGLREIYRSDDRFLYHSYDQLYRSFEKLYYSAESVYYPEAIPETPTNANIPEAVSENPNY